jgi:histone deacetylase 1/2
MDSGIPTPARAEIDDVVTAMATEANAEGNAELVEQKTLGANAESGEQGLSNAPSRAHSPKLTVDTEGDVDMTGAAPPSEVKAPSPASIPATSPTVAIAPATTTPAPVEPVAEAVDPTGVKKEREAERIDADVTAKASTEIAEQSQP